MSEFIDAHLVELSVGFIVFCVFLVIGAVWYAARHSHEDEEMEAMRRHREGK